MYECHITLSVKDAVLASKLAKDFHWKTSEIARDPVLGDDTYYYLTSHHTNYTDMFVRLRTMVQNLEINNINVIREKIEHIVYDTKAKYVS
jgi:hypothetical protein